MDGTKSLGGRGRTRQTSQPFALCKLEYGSGTQSSLLWSHPESSLTLTSTKLSLAYLSSSLPLNTKLVA